MAWELRPFTKKAFARDNPVIASQLGYRDLDKASSYFGNSNGTYYNTISKSWNIPKETVSSRVMTAIAGATGIAVVGSLASSSAVGLADWLTDGGTSEAIRQLEEKNKDRTQPAPSVEVSSDLLNPYKSSEFNPTWSDENSPSLLAGTMQSAEVIALSIGSLVQVLADNHVEDMQYKTADMMIKYEHGERISQSLEIIAPALISLIQILNQPTLSNAIMDNAAAIASSIHTQPVAQLETVNSVSALDVSGIVSAIEALQNSPQSEARNEALQSIKNELEGIKTHSQTNSEAMTSLKGWSESAKANEDYKKQPMAIHDLDGNLVANASPREIEAVKNASDARHKTDTNNLEFDDNDIPDLPNLPSLIGWFGRGDIFNPEYTPPENPFMRQW